MTSVIKLKRSATAAAVPTLVDGEIAVNVADRKLFVGPPGDGAGVEIDGGDLVRAARRSVQVQSVTAAATLNINMALGHHVILALGANVTTLTVSNPPAAGIVGKLTLDIVSSGDFDITDWPGATIWAGGEEPNISFGAGKKDTIVLSTVDGGTTYRGFVVGQDFS